ncbi:MAG: T9SS type A sorting domain-containing protein [Fibrobacteres bacterium]|nr:T9SS type A sorting domain-containing protein [Fibrobacterota bacterium]
MKTYMLILIVAAVSLFAEVHKFPQSNAAIPYLVNDNPALRLYRIPVAEGERSYISGGWSTDTNRGYRHRDFAVDFDTRVGQMAYCARAGRVYFIEEAPGGLPSYYTIQIGRPDSIRDSTRANGWRKVLSLDMYRHVNGTTKLVKIGDWVEQGAPIAKVNDIAHVHFEVNINSWTTQSPTEESLQISSIPISFQDITTRPMGYPVMYDTYTSINTIYISAEQPLLSKMAVLTPAIDASPNPFSPYVNFTVSLPADAGNTSLALYDACGRLLETLFSKAEMGKGVYRFPMQSQSLAKGGYIIRLNTDKGNYSRNIIKR